jgi:hypothetical protein
MAFGDKIQATLKIIFFLFESFTLLDFAHEPFLNYEFQHYILETECFSVLREEGYGVCNNFFYRAQMVHFIPYSSAA